jgi:predicted ABC-type transport system involved in lysophospholipase L1 biosynthesis ATPase subunit
VSARTFRPDKEGRNDRSGRRSDAMVQSRSRGITVVIGTHGEALAARCDTTVRLRDGRLVQA